MARPTTWFTPLERPPFVAEHRDAAGPPPGLRVLEISSRSNEPFGRALSAMRLRAAGEDGDRAPVVETVYQAAKCYGDGGPDDRPAANGFDAKRRDRERRKEGALRGFQHDGTHWPAASGSAFYDRLWIQAAVAAGAARELARYDAYTDQFHRPGISVACQARAAAMLVGLDRSRRIDRIYSTDQWAETLQLGEEARPVRPSNPSGLHAAEAGQKRAAAAAAAPGVEARVLVCGSRDFDDHGLVAAKLDEIRQRLGDVPMRVIAGAARGADSLAAAWAERHGVPCDEYPADWDLYGRSAGYRRNERMLTEGDPHVVVAFPLGESRGTRQMMRIAAAAGVAVEEVDARTRTTLTDTGTLYNVAAIARRAHAAGRPAGPVAALPIGRIAKLENHDPRERGEIRVVVGGVRRAGAAERLVHAKLDEVLARAHPRVLRIAVELQPGKDDLSTVAATWARRRGVHCDQYRIDDPDEAKTAAGRIMSEQKPHLAVAFARGGQAGGRLAAAAERAGVPVETVDAKGINRTRTGTMTDLGAEAIRNAGRRAEPNEAWVVPIPGRAARENWNRVGRAAHAPWTQPGHESPAGATLNLRDRAAYNAVRAGAAVRIDRKTEWGNPFPLGDRADAAERRDVIEQYREYLSNAIDAGHVDIDKLARLDGKALACHCAPEPCHGDVLAEAASWAAERKRERAHHRNAETPNEAVPPERTAEVDIHVFDPGDDDWDDARPSADEPVRNERPDPDLPQHADDLAADRLERYRERIAEAGATEKQLAAVDGDVAALRESAADARARAHHAPDKPISDQMRIELERHNDPLNPANIARTLATPETPGEGPRRAAGQPPAPPPAPAPAPPPATEPTREVRVLVTGSWRHDEPADVYRKLDEVRQRIAGAPMRIVTGDGRGAHESAAGWAAEAGVPCDVYPADWDAYGAEAGKERDERMVDDSRPHAVVTFTRPGDRGGDFVMELAAERDIGCEHVDHHGHTVTPEEERPDLEAIGRRTSDAPPENPQPSPAPAQGASIEATIARLQDRRPEREPAAAR